VDNWTGARQVSPDGGPLVLLIATTRVTGGKWQYAYSVYPGINVIITAPGGYPPADPCDPILIGEVIRLGELYARSRGPDSGDTGIL
jgi:hypothetical protein